MAELLIVDDDKSLRENLRELFLAEGYEVRTAGDGEIALRRFAERRPDLLLVDLMMPKMNGNVFIGRIRELDRRVPIIVLTARDSEMSEVRSLGIGADDFVSKSADGEVLRLRIARALERVREFSARDPSETVEIADGIAVDFNLSAVRDHGAEIAHLTPTECGILRDLLGCRGEFLMLEKLLRNRRGEGYVCEDSMMYVHISNLRKKLGRVGGLLQNDRCRGYRLLK